MKKLLLPIFAFAILLGMPSSAWAAEGDLVWRDFPNAVPVQMVYGMASDTSGLYLALVSNNCKTSHTEKWDYNGNILWSHSKTNSGGACAMINGIAVSADGVYAVGFDYPNNFLEKRDLITGAPIWPQSISISSGAVPGDVSVGNIQINSGTIFLEGGYYNRSTNKWELHLEKRSALDGVFIYSNNFPGNYNGFTGMSSVQSGHFVVDNSGLYISDTAGAAIQLKRLSRREVLRILVRYGGLILIAAADVLSIKELLPKAIFLALATNQRHWLVVADGWCKKQKQTELFRGRNTLMIASIISKLIQRMIFHISMARYTY